MTLKSTALFLLFTASLAAHAIDLKPIPAGHDPALPDVDDKPIACDQIVNRLAALQQKVSSHEGSLNSFLGQINQAFKDWYAQLSPLEGTTQTIAPGTFSSLEAAATNTDSVVNDAFDNTDKITTEMANIVGAARGCTITTPPTVVSQGK